MAEIMVKCDDAVHFSTRYIQDVGDQRLGLAVDIAKFLLQGMQDRQQRPRHRLFAGNDGAGHIDIPGRVRAHGILPRPATVLICEIKHMLPVALVM